jgi:hypothetical protein
VSIVCFNNSTSLKLMVWALIVFPPKASQLYTLYFHPHPANLPVPCVMLRLQVTIDFFEVRSGGS